MKKPSILTALAVIACSVATGSYAKEGVVTPLFSTDIPEFSGKEVVMINVDYAPGGETPIHRHNAHALVYVLEGAIVMQVKGQDAKTLTSGDTYYESPDDIHLVSRNASDTEPAKFIVFILKEKDNSIVIPAN